MVDYKDAGVNIELGDDVSKILYNAARLTWKNRQGRCFQGIKEDSKNKGNKEKMKKGQVIGQIFIYISPTRKYSY